LITIDDPGYAFVLRLVGQVTSAYRLRCSETRPGAIHERDYNNRIKFGAGECGASQSPYVWRFNWPRSQRFSADSERKKIAPKSPEVFFAAFAAPPISGAVV
jgi:hypothetical protein